MRGWATAGSRQLAARENCAMATAAGRVLVAAAACLLTLTGCETSVKLGDLLQSKGETKSETGQPLPPSAQTDPATTGSVRPPLDDF